MSRADANAPAENLRSIVNAKGMLPLTTIKVAPSPDKPKLVTEVRLGIVTPLTPGYGNRTLERVLATMSVLMLLTFYIEA